MSVGLVSLVPAEAVLRPRVNITLPRTGVAVAPLLTSAEKLGTWFKDLTLFEIAGLLRIEF